MSYLFPNGVYGINLTKRLEGSTVANLALLTEMAKTYEELDEDRCGDPSQCIGSQVYQLFHQRLESVLYGQGIIIPTLDESKVRDTMVFRIHQVDSHASVGDSEGFDPGDLILGVGILGFPNDIKFRAGFMSSAAWHLWAVDG